MRYAVPFPEFQFKALLPVTFNRPVDGGSFMLKSVKNAPVILWSIEPNSTTFYSYICFDPDSSVPSWIHMMILNCTKASLDSGTTVFEWSPPAPASGTHRYIFGLYKHSYPVNTKEFTTNRGGFNVNDFLGKKGFIPVAGAFMTATKGV